MGWRRRALESGQQNNALITLVPARPLRAAYAWQNQPSVGYSGLRNGMNSRSDRFLGPSTALAFVVGGGREGIQMQSEIVGGCTHRAVAAIHHEKWGCVLGWSSIYFSSRGCTMSSRCRSRLVVTLALILAEIEQRAHVTEPGTQLGSEEAKGCEWP